MGAPGLHKSLRKLAGTWKPIFPKHVMDDVEKAMNHAGTISSQESRKPMTRDPRLAGDTGSSDAPVGDILSLLARSGNISQLLGVKIPGNSLKTGEVTTSLELKSETIKERNQAAINRLLSATRANQSIFLDNKFLKKKVRDSTKEHSQMWYVDIETWYQGTTAQDVQPDSGSNKRDADESAQGPLMSVPVDESQTECAVSGEKFERFWDDELQEWRYLDAMRVSGSLAKRYVFIASIPQYYLFITVLRISIIYCFRLGVPAGSLVCASTVDLSDRLEMNQTLSNRAFEDAQGFDSKRLKLEHT